MYIFCPLMDKSTRLHYCYRIMDTHTGEEVSRVERTKQLKDHMLVSVQSDPENENNLYACLFKKENISIIKIDAISGQFHLVSENKTSINDVNEVFLDQSSKNVFVSYIHSSDNKSESKMLKYALSEMSYITSKHSFDQTSHYSQLNYKAAF